MSPPRLSEIFDTYFDLPVPERPEYLERVCGSDPELRRKALALIEASGKLGSFLSPPGAGDETPESIGKYRVLRELGRGAMGVVYLAEDPELLRQIAIKTLTGWIGSSPTYRDKLRKEALALAALSQPNVAQIYTLEDQRPVAGDAQRASGAPAFITMEYVPGTSLTERLRSPSFGLETALDYGRQIASALEAAHDRGIVHRDLKPPNIRITPDGWVKVLDFGLAQSAGPAGPMHGTLGYMSPEQLDGGTVAPPSDIWAFGCLLYECLTRTRAFPGPPEEVVRATRKGSVDLETLGPDVPDTIVSLVGRCLDLDPEVRPDATQARRLLEEELLRLRSAPFIGATTWRPRPEEKGNLPSLAGSYLGRETELATLGALLRQHRLVTLLGMGGAGKTRTALELAHRHEALYPDGAWFVELAEIDDPEAIASHVARNLDLRSGKEADLFRVVEEAIGDGTSLLLLDNCEHVIRGASDFAGKLLTRCPQVRILATSREPLGLDGEQSYPLPPLELPATAMAASETRHVASLSLFETRARARDPKFHLDEENTPVVAEICRALDGLPLAIELAAGHVRVLSLEQIAERVRLDRGFLGDRDRTRSPRHRSLRGLVDWSYQLLPPEESALLDRLSLFRGSWTLETAESVCADDVLPRWQIFGALGRLVEKSLVEVEPAGLAIRYRLLETVRHFALERLAEREAGDPSRRAPLRERYVSFFLEVATPGEAEQGLNDTGWLKRMRREFTDISQALDLALQAGRIDLAMPLCLLLARFGGHEGRWREALETADRVLAADPGAGTRDSAPGASRTVIAGGRSSPTDARVASDPEHRVGVLTQAAEMAAHLDEFARAEAYVTEGTLIAQSSASPRALGRIHGAAGIVSFYQVRLDEADARFGECERILRDAGDRAGLARCLADRGRVRSVSGEHDEATPLYQESLRLSRELGDALSGARVLVNLGRTARLLGRDDEAIALIEQALQIHRDANDTPGVALCLPNLAESTWRFRKDHAKARDYLREALRIRFRSGQKNSVCSALLDFLELEEDAGNGERAAVLLGGVLEAYETYGLFLYDGPRGRLQQAEERLVAKIGAERIRMAKERGQRMTVRELVQMLENGAGQTAGSA